MKFALIFVALLSVPPAIVSAAQWQPNRPGVLNRDPAVQALVAHSRHMARPAPAKLAAIEVPTTVIVVPSRARWSGPGGCHVRRTETFTQRSYVRVCNSELPGRPQKRSTGDLEGRSSPPKSNWIALKDMATGWR